MPMKPPSARLFPDVITCRTATYTNVKGVRTPSYTDSTVAASVQPADPNRLPAHLRESAKTVYRVLLAIDPGLKVGDQLTWRGRTLLVEGPAADQAGRQAMWIYHASEVT